MNRKEEIFEQVLNTSPATELHSYIAGILWADENPKDGARDFLIKADKYLRDFTSGNFHFDSKKELYVFLNELSEFLK